MTRSLGAFLTLMLLGMGSSGVIALAAQDGYEIPPALRASDLLPAEMLSGDHFEVAPDVATDGFMNLFSINSEYGEFHAYGKPELAILIRQIEAMVKLDEVSVTDQFLEAAGETVTDQVDTVKSVAEHPATVAKALPKGIFHMFRRYKNAAEAGVHTATALVADEDDEFDASDGYAEEWDSVTDTERDWYQKLEIDPYHHNRVLSEKVSGVARVDVMAGAGMSFAPVPSIPGASYLGEVTEAVWTINPAELREQNAELLRAAGVDEEMVARFLDNGFISPTHQAATAMALSRLNGVGGLEVLVEISALADSLELAQLNVANILLLTAYHSERVPLGEVLPGAPVPVVLDESGDLVILVSADYSFWVEDLAPVIEVMAARFADHSATSRKLWLRGKASQQFIEEVGELGWTVRQEIDLAVSEGDDLVP